MIPSHIFFSVRSSFSHMLLELLYGSFLTKNDLLMIFFENFLHFFCGRRFLGDDCLEATGHTSLTSSFFNTNGDLQFVLWILNFQYKL